MYISLVHCVICIYHSLFNSYIELLGLPQMFLSEPQTSSFLNLKTQFLRNLLKRRLQNLHPSISPNLKGISNFLIYFYIIYFLIVSVDKISKTHSLFFPGSRDIIIHESEKRLTNLLQNQSSTSLLASSCASSDLFLYLLCFLSLLWSF